MQTIKDAGKFHWYLNFEMGHSKLPIYDIFLALVFKEYLKLIYFDPVLHYYAGFKSIFYLYS